jgi:hypothetical protein
MKKYKNLIGLLILSFFVILGIINLRNGIDVFSVVAIFILIFFLLIKLMLILKGKY